MCVPLLTSRLDAARTQNGISIGMLVPSLQALVGDMHSSRNRGKAFGYLNFTGITGAIVGGAIATILAANTYWGYAGWRVAFILWTALLVVVIVGFSAFAAAGLDEVDAKKGSRLSEFVGMSWGEYLRREAVEGVAKSAAVLAVPTLQVIIIPQAIGLLPWMAMTGWVTFYLEAMGFSNTATAILLLMVGLGFAAGSILGGLVGDWAESLDRYRGRIALAQVTILISAVAFLFDLQVFLFLLPL